MANNAYDDQDETQPRIPPRIAWEGEDISFRGQWSDLGSIFLLTAPAWIFLVLVAFVGAVVFSGLAGPAPV